MNEEQLADLLAQHLDALLEGGSLPEILPSEMADLLTVAQSLSEAAPVPRPEFGFALKESLLGPTEVGNGPTSSVGSVVGSQKVLVVVVGLLTGAVILALLVSSIIFGTVRLFQGSSTSTPAPLQTQTIPTQPNPAPLTPTQTAESTATSQPAGSESTPMITATPIIDVLPAISVTIEIIVEPTGLVPGPSGGGGGAGGDGEGGDGGGGDDDGDHDRGHGNDSDHHDEDNPGQGGNKR